MPTSAPGTFDPIARSAVAGRSGGFTLIEIMVVVLIIGVLSTVATLALAPESDARVARRDAERLALLLESLALEASVTGQVLGLAISDREYRFVRRDTVLGWVPLQGDDLFRPRLLDDRTRLKGIEADGVPLPPEAHLQFRPAGAPEFLIELQSGEALVALRGTSDGRVTMQEEANAPPKR